ncbi:MAG TPA: C40 family peptidase [Candidatus Dormibacteraeota bacterium]|nr:C40 family peptidase [Candidatus Dormibacteraeota bacterium]
MKNGVKRLLFSALLIVFVSACGASPATSASPTASVPLSPSPSPSPTATPELAAGAPAWVSVSVASGWRSPQASRAVDAPALQNPANIRAWLTGMSSADKVGLIGRLDTQALLGEEVLVLQITGEWAQVAVRDQPSPLDVRGYPVWIPVRQLTASPPPRSDTSVVVTAPTAWLRSGATSLEVSFGTWLPLLGRQGGADVVGVPGGSRMSIDAQSVGTAPVAGSGSAIVAGARTFLGLPYLWGGTSGFGYDCTGLVYLIFKAHGITVPRDSDPQSRAGVAVSRADLQPGDLIFFSAHGTAYHVAIYSGAGMVIDSPSPGYPVEEVALALMPNVADLSAQRRFLTR